MSLFYEDDIETLRAELTSVRARQELLADALAAATEELEILTAERNLIEGLAAEALDHLQAIDYEEGSRIDRAVQAVEAIAATL